MHLVSFRIYFPQMPSIRILRYLVLGTIIGQSALTTYGQNTPAELTPDCSAYASVPLPAEAENLSIPKVFPTCASYRSYRGIGRPVNYSQARACAWRERLAQEAKLGQNQEEPTAWVVGGSLILADIYLNGAGVKRNIPLAMRLACESEEKMVNIALPEIAKLNSSPRASRPFELCDYAATTFTMNFCSDYASEIEGDRRDRFYRSLKSTMTPPQQAVFEKLLAAKKEYISAHASEVDQGGTIRGIRTLGSQNILEDLFRTELVHFERKKWPALSEKQITWADKWLIREFDNKLQQLRAKSRDESDSDEITAENLSEVQANWQKYRDAWVTFAGLRYPSATSAIRAKITLDRYRLLKTIN